MSANHKPSAEPMAIPPTPDHQPPAHARSLSLSFASGQLPNLPTGAAFASRPPASPPATFTTGSVSGGTNPFSGSPSTSSVLSSNSPITPSPILASALSLPSGAGFNPFFSTSPSSAASFAPAPGSSYGHHARSFSITGGAGAGKPVVVSGFGPAGSGAGAAAGSALADDDDDSPPASAKFALPLRRPSTKQQQPVKLPAQLQAQIKPPSAAGQGAGGGHGGAASAAPAAGSAGETSAGRGHGVLRRLSLGANSLLSRPNLAPNPAQPAGPLPTTATATAGGLADGGRARTTSRSRPGAAGTAKKRGISPTGERILQGHF